MTTDEGNTPADGGIDRRTALAGIGAAAFAAPTVVSTSLVPGFAAATTAGPTTTTLPGMAQDCGVFTGSLFFRTDVDRPNYSNFFEARLDVVVGDEVITSEVPVTVVYNEGLGGGISVGVYFGSYFGQFSQLDYCTLEAISFDGQVYGPNDPIGIAIEPGYSEHVVELFVNCCPPGGIGPGGCTVVGTWKEADCESFASPVTTDRTIEIDFGILPDGDDYFSNVPEVTTAATNVFNAGIADNVRVVLDVSIPTTYGGCLYNRYTPLTVGTLDVDFGLFADIDAFTDAIAAELAAAGAGTFVVDTVGFSRRVDVGLSGTGNGLVFLGTEDQGTIDAVLRGPEPPLPSGLGGFCVRDECAENPCDQCTPRPEAPADVVVTYDDVYLGATASLFIGFTLERPDGTTVSDTIRIRRRQGATTFSGLDPIEITTTYTGEIICAAL